MNSECCVDGKPVYYDVRRSTPKRTENCESCAASLFCMTGTLFSVTTCVAHCDRVTGLHYPLGFERGQGLNGRSMGNWNIGGRGIEKYADANVVNDVLRCIVRGYYGTNQRVSAGKCLPCHLKAQSRKYRVPTATGSFDTFFEGLSYVTQPADPAGRKGKP
jgi:hypothetical protein